ncbi:hypothetical protein SAY86_021557 [Trapa natans]|uniref:Uncharacterized protein n=1 Tax=Trapa natans TaxID=22666 RepID=A0AAN7MSN0_TRANT|nr:hypothetical protein SAY86_021557 [Trapa natans]
MNLLFHRECCTKLETPSMYPRAKGILHALEEKGIGMAIASCSPRQEIAKTFLDKLHMK